MSKVAIYVRVSTVHQVDKDSLPFQRQELINYTKYALNIDEYEIFEDAGYSAKNTKRPKYQQMMARIRNNEFTHILVFKIDRISRNLKDFTEMYEEIKDYQVTFVSKSEQFDTSTPMGEAMLKIILVFAELERQMTAERVFTIMLDRAEKGLWNGATVPIGYVWSDEVKFPVIDKDEAVIVQYIYDLYEKLRSTIKVAIRLNEENIQTKRGGEWTPKTVRDILRNPFYIGTYRYNVRKNNSKSRYKDKSEWIVKENNHPAIIDKEQYFRVNIILNQNFRGNLHVQRENMHTHIFGKKLFCGNCGKLLFSAKDRERKDGYRPSRYTCSTNESRAAGHSCSNFISDVTLLPFMLNYVSNLIRLQDKVTPNHTLRDIESLLLRGEPFVDVLGVDKEGLKITKDMILAGFEKSIYNFKPEDIDGESSLEINKLKKSLDKYKTALERLENLYLFGEEAISEKEYIFKKRKLMEKHEELTLELNNLYESLPIPSNVNNAWMNKAKKFLLSQEIYRNRDTDYRRLIDNVGEEMLLDFFNTIIEKVIIHEKKVTSIIFKNGLTHHFAHKPFEKRIKRKNNTRFYYRKFMDQVLNYIKENGPVRRVDIENLTNLKRTTTNTLLNELIDQNLIEKRGVSVKIRYYYKGK
ncbi:MULTISPECIES: recombinase family protein [Oceanobacillus]|uniref:recombinase family protein n=1 Tax=Oceanobacillus TaxID=182709 RepID=UPI0005963929|nr:MULTISPECIES: recombinase family protein [Oceanobacillus]